MVKKPYLINLLKDMLWHVRKTGSTSYHWNRICFWAHPNSLDSFNTAASVFLWMIIMIQSLIASLWYYFKSFSFLVISVFTTKHLFSLGLTSHSFLHNRTLMTSSRMPDPSSKCIGFPCSKISFFSRFWAKEALEKSCWLNRGPRVKCSRWRC